VRRPASLRLGLFSPSPVLFAAGRLGLLGQAALELEVEAVRSSLAQFADLAEGRYDVVLTSPDNVLSYRYDEANLLGRRIDVRILAGVDRGMGLSLLSTADVCCPADLAGRRIGVDVVASGFAVALFALLGRDGLRPGQDYVVLELGATPRRLDALLSGVCDATLLNAGFDLRAEAAGARRLVRVGRVLTPYLGTVLASTASALERSASAIGRFRDVWSSARAALFGPTGAALLDAFAQDELGLRVDEARAFAITACSKEEGLVEDGVVEAASLRLLLGLRRDLDAPGERSVAEEVLASDEDLVVSERS
jgi:ABC-type nitrate/sulfonate/bicarbonate transport system substrate-binding protein